MIVLRDAGTSDDGTSEWGWAIDYISVAQGSDEAGIGGSVSTELSPTDDGLMRMEFVDPWAKLTTAADGDAQTQFRLEIDQSYLEDLSETQALTEPTWMEAVTSGLRAGDSELVFHYAESANYQGNGLSELLGIDVKPTAEADLEWRGTQADYIRIESSDVFDRQYDEYDMEGTHLRDTHGHNVETFFLELANLVTTDGDLAGELTYNLVSESEDEEVWEADASWMGDADETAEGRVKYHSTLDSTGHELMRSETGEWITLYDGQEDREATFERIATAARAFDPETGELTAGEFTWTGDAHVQLFGTDLSETEWTPNELEEALNTIFTEDSEGYPEPPEDEGDDSDVGGSGGDVIDPYVEDDGWVASMLMPAVSWFGGRRGDMTDQAFNFTYGVGDELLLGAPRYFRQHAYGDLDQVDYDGNAYYIGGWTGTIVDLVSGSALVKTGGKQVLKAFSREAIGEGMETLAKRGPRGTIGLRTPRSAGTGGRAWTHGFGRISDEVAEGAYAAIRESTTDVAAISRYTGYKPERLQRIKDYLFNNPEWLGADGEIAAAWHRLRTGRGTDVDKMLLKHETAEIWLRANKLPDYIDAHRAANQRWNWEELLPWGD